LGQLERLYKKKPNMQSKLDMQKSDELNSRSGLQKALVDRQIFGEQQMLSCDLCSTTGGNS